MKRFGTKETRLVISKIKKLFFKSKSDVFSKSEMKEIEHVAISNGFLNAQEYLLEMHSKFKRSLSVYKPFKLDPKKKLKQIK